MGSAYAGKNVAYLAGVGKDKCHKDVDSGSE